MPTHKLTPQEINTVRMFRGNPPKAYTLTDALIMNDSRNVKWNPSPSKSTIVRLINVIKSL